MIDLNSWYEQYRKNTDRVKFEMVQSAARELFKAVQERYYDREDLTTINYSEVTEWLGWPDLQDNGIFEEIINIAANTVLGIMGFKPTHFID